MAGLYEIWRDPTRDDDDPTRFLWTCTVLTTTAEDAVGHIHDRMPLLVEPRALRRLARPAVVRRRRRCTALLVPAAPGRLEAYPVAHRGQQRAQQRARAGRAAARRAGGRRDDRRARSVPTPHGDARLHRDRVAAPGRRRCCSATAPAAASTPPTSRRWPRRLPAQRHLGGPGRAALAGGRQEGRAAPRGARRVLRGRRRHAAGAHPAGRRRPQRRRPVACRTARELGAVGRAWRWRSRCTRPAGRSSRGSPSSQAVAVPTLVVQGERDPFGRPEEFPPDRELTVVPGADHGFRVPSAGRSPPRRRWRSSSRRCWSGWSATWSGAGNRSGDDVLRR